MTLLFFTCNWGISKFWTRESIRKRYALWYWSEGFCVKIYDELRMDDNRQKKADERGWLSMFSAGWVQEGGRLADIVAKASSLRMANALGCRRSGGSFLACVREISLAMLLVLLAPWGITCAGSHHNTFVSDLLQRMVTRLWWSFPIILRLDHQFTSSTIT